MKKKAWFILTGMLMMAALYGACAFAAVSGEALSYYPVSKPGNKWEYAVSMGDKSGLQVFAVIQPDDEHLMVAVASNGRVQAIISYLESEKGLLREKEISGTAITYFTPAQLVLPAKPTAGDKWSWASENGKMKETDVIDFPATKVTVPAGSFDALLVSSEGMDEKGASYTDKSWFAKGVGMVREEYNYDGKLIVLQLLRYQVK